MRDKIKLHVMLDKQTFIDYSNFNVFSATPETLLLLIFFFVLMAGFGVYSLITEQPYIGTAFIVLAFAYLAGYIAYYKSAQKKQIQRFGLDTPQFFYDITVSNEGVYADYEKEAENLPWANVYAVYALDKYFYVYAAKKQGYILPIATLQDGASAEELLLTCMLHVPESKMHDRRKVKTPIPQALLDAVVQSAEDDDEYEEDVTDTQETNTTEE